MKRKSKKNENERSVLLDTYEKDIEFSKFQIANNWLMFLKSYQDQLKNFKFAEVFDKSFHDYEKDGYMEWLKIIFEDVDMYELDYDEIVRKLKSSIKHSTEVLGIPEYVKFGTIEIIRDGIDEETGLVRCYRKLNYILREDK